MKCSQYCAYEKTLSGCIIHFKCHHSATIASGCSFFTQMRNCMFHNGPVISLPQIICC